MTTQADEIRWMAEHFDSPLDNIKFSSSQETFRKAAAMLREYAEGVERIDAAEHLILWNVDNFQDLPLSDNYYEKWLGEARIYIRTHINPPSPLTAALSGREGDSSDDPIEDPEPLCTVCGDYGCAACEDVK